MKKLSAKQREIYRCIVELSDQKGYPPSVREIGEAVGLRSPSTVHMHLKALHEAGLIQKDDRKTRALNINPGEGAQRGRVPILGRVQAGSPILAVEDCEGYLPYDMGGDAGEHCALRVRGDSMSGVGILEGDYVVVRRQEAADHGDIVVALLGDEATVKRLRRTRGGAVWLMAENPNYEPIDGRNCAILGKVMALVRKME